MNVFRDIIIVLSFLGLFVYCYFLMKRLDKYICESRKDIENDSEKEEPSCIILTEKMSGEEVENEIRKFRGQHKNTRIILYDGDKMELSDVTESDRKI